MKKIQAYLILGCAGSKKNNFIFCRGTNNIIIDLEKIDDDVYIEFENFLDKACDLFEHPVLDYNKCSNILNVLHKKYALYSDEMLYNIQRYCKIHRECEIFINLVLKENYHGRNT